MKAACILLLLSILGYGAWHGRNKELPRSLPAPVRQQPPNPQPWPPALGTWPAGYIVKGSNNNG